VGKQHLWLEPLHLHFPQSTNKPLVLIYASRQSQIRKVLVSKETSFVDKGVRLKGRSTEKNNITETNLLHYIGNRAR
jgi:hypothetical protein